MTRHKPTKHEQETEQPEMHESTGAKDAELDQFAADIEAMQDELDRLRNDAEESHDRYMRMMADFDNFRKRQRDETSRQIGCAREELILKLLPIIENFRRATESAEAGHSYEALVEGVSLTLRQLTEMLEKEGVEPIDAVGEEFNPELHEAVMRCEPDECPENTVVEVFENGYTLNGKLLRPAKVRVAASE
jgi:molecular chaperone GrpE